MYSPDCETIAHVENRKKSKYFKLLHRSQAGNSIRECLLPRSHSVAAHLQDL